MMFTLTPAKKSMMSEVDSGSILTLKATPSCCPHPVSCRPVMKENKVYVIADESAPFILILHCFSGNLMLQLAGVDGII